MKQFYLLLVTAASLIVCCFGDNFPPEKHVKQQMDDVRDVKLILDEASRMKMKKFGQNQSTLSSNYTPIVFWHGMGDTAFGSINMDRLALQKNFPGMIVLSIQVGNNSLEDELAGYFVNVNTQIEGACKELLKNDIIRQHKAFNAVGFSQGSQFLRGLIQRCPFREHGIRVKNFISLGGQHQGVFGLPNCLYGNLICDHVRYLLTNAAYERNVQEHCVQAEYWHDPYREEEYKNRNVFLADINNELELNETYRRNLASLDSLVLVKFKEDEMVIPRESSLFGFYATNETKKIVPLEESDLYLEDRLGLKELNEKGRLRMIEVPGNHLHYKMKWFLDEIASMYLNN